MLGDQLARSLGDCTARCVLVAPYVKVDALERLLSSVPSTVNVELITRWRIDDVVIGVTDPRVLEVVENRGNGAVYLCDDLHAKYYAVDGRVAWIGSANITLAALGWSRTPNREILVELPIDECLWDFERSLRAASYPATREMMERVLDVAEAARDVLPLVRRTDNDSRINVDETEGQEDIGDWVPHSRNPEQLYRAYAGRWSELTAGARVTAMRDLAVLAIPPGLDEHRFSKWVGARLVMSGVVRRIDGALSAGSQRFGAIRALVAKMLANDAERDPSEATQAIYRWLTYFLPARYRVRVANFSEILERVSQDL